MRAIAVDGRHVGGCAGSAGGVCARGARADLKERCGSFGSGGGEVRCGDLSFGARCGWSCCIACGFAAGNGWVPK